MGSAGDFNPALWRRSYAGLVLLAFFVNYPGRLTPDSFSMLLQAGSPSVLENWHAVSVTWLWSLLSPPVPQPAGALLIQCLVIFPYPAAVLVDRAQNWLFRILVPVVLIPVAGSLTKDLILVGYVLCLFGVLQYLRGANRMRWAAAAVFLGALVRPTNFVVFALAGTLWAFTMLRGRRALQAMIPIAAIAVLLVPATALIDRGLFDPRDRQPERSLIIYDLAGISNYAHVDVFADLPGWPSGDLPRPWDCYTPVAWDPFAWGECRAYYRAYDQAGTLGKRRILTWWVSSILSHPLAYMQHRLNQAYILLTAPTAILDDPPDAINAPGADISVVETYRLKTDGLFTDWTVTLKYVPFGKVAGYLVNWITVLAMLLVCVVFSILQFRQARPDPLIAIAAGIGVANFVMLVFLGVANEGRYMLPTYYAGMVCLMLATQRHVAER